MKRSEFVDIVNAVWREEAARTANDFKVLLENSDPKHTTAELIAHLITVSTENAARVTGSIIEKSGILHFDPEDAD